MWVKSVICSLLSMSVVGNIRSALGHNEVSARKLAGAGCSELFNVHRDRNNLSGMYSVPKERGRYVKMQFCEENLFPCQSFKKSGNSWGKSMIKH